MAKVYVFKGHEYIRYDIASGKAEGGYPRPIAPDWPGLMPLIDWVNWSTQPPDHALMVGREGDGTHFLCAAVDRNAVYPGKLWSKSNSCYYSDGQREVKTVSMRSRRRRCRLHGSTGTLLPWSD